jgi:hypothetical protein
MIFFPEAGFGIFYIDDACKSLIFHRIFAGLDYTWPIYGSGCAHMAVWHPRRRTKQFWFNDSKTRIIVGTYEQFNSFPEVPHPRAKVRLSLAVACLHGSVASQVSLPPQCGTWHAQIEHDLAPGQPSSSNTLSHQHTRKLNLPSSIVHFFPQGPSTHGQSASVPVCGCHSMAAAAASVPMAVWQPRACHSHHLSAAVARTHRPPCCAWPVAGRRRARPLTDRARPGTRGARSPSAQRPGPACRPLLRRGGGGCRTCALQGTHMHMHIHTHTETHAHAHTHTHTHTHMHTHRETHTASHTHTHTHTHTQAHIQTHTHTHIHRHMHTHTHTGS